MITAIVRFTLSEGTTCDDAKAMFEKSAPNYRGIPGLVRKYYLYGDDRTGGGVYLWNDREAAERFYSDSWKSSIAQRFGSKPEILFYETPVIVDNVAATTTTAAA
ncbi:MAG: monooxygenase [Xanthobacteraceae bacterium]